MLTPGGRGGIAETTPLLKGNDPEAAAANWTWLNQCIRNAKRFRGAITIRLPAGFHWLKRPAADEQPVSRKPPTKSGGSGDDEARDGAS